MGQKGGGGLMKRGWFRITFAESRGVKDQRRDWFLKKGLVLSRCLV